MTDPTTPPGDLGDRGRAYWRRIRADYELSDSEAAVLHEIGRALDELDDLHAAVLADGVTVPGSKGQPRPHPALADLRQHRAAVVRLIAALSLPPDDARTAPPDPTTTKAQKAARSRWVAHGSP